jgi:hypothetical protein
MYLTTMADVTWLKSARLSFNFGGTGFVTRRQKSSLYGVVGASARGDVAYRVTRHSSVGADYFYTHFGYNKAFGTGDLHSVGADYSIDLTSRWQFRFRAGVIRMETLYLGLVTLDPAVAAILGQSQGVAALYRLMRRPSYSGQAARRIGHGSLSFGYTYGASPGNGIYLTSQQSTGSAGYSYTGLRRWSLSSQFTYTNMHGVGQNVGDYVSYGGGFGASRGITHQNLSLTFRSDIRHTSAGTGFLRTYYMSSIGLAFSPGDLPLRLW